MEVFQGKEIHNGNYSGADFSNLTREQKDAVRKLRQEGEAMGTYASDIDLIHSMVTQSVNDKLEAAVTCGVMNAANDSDTITQSSTTESSYGGDVGVSGDSHQSAKCKAQSVNVGEFLSNKKLQISFKPNK